MSQLRHTLDEVQRWMQAVITHPAGPATAIVSREAVAIGVHANGKE